MRGHILIGTSPLQKIPEVVWEVRGKRILDVGCGAGIYGYLLRNSWHNTWVGQDQMRKISARDPNNDKPAFLAGVDIRMNDVLRSRYHNVYDYLCLADASKLPFPENFVDTIVCIEVLEHLKKQDALKAIQDFKKIASQQIIITIPKDAVEEITETDERAFLKIDTEDAEVLEFIKAEKHKSRFTQNELQSLGFQIGETIYDSGVKGFLKKIRRIYRNKIGRNKYQILAVCYLNKQDASPNLENPIAKNFYNEIPDFR
jgi:SAM-dependent methyltransferase